MTAEKIEAWTVITNTDLNEGRGSQFVKFVCELKATAIKLGRHGYVQGSDCPISKVSLLRYNDGKCYDPMSAITVITPIAEDVAVQKRMDIQDARKSIDDMFDSFQQLGISTEDVERFKQLLDELSAP